MSLRRVFVVPFSILTLAACAVSLTSISGCPVPQPPTPGGSSGGDTSDQTDGTPDSGTSRPTIARPIPPVVVEIPDDGDGAGGSSGGGFSPIPGQPGSGSGDGSGQPTISPITIEISAPQTTDINIVPGGIASISYEVLGGSPQDGAISTALFLDLDGVAETGDEQTIAGDIPPRGTETFAPAVPPGIYFMGLRASNSRQTATSYARGRLIVVGQASATLVQPASNVRVRPNAPVSVRFNINSLATSVNWQVFLDPDTTVNGNELPTTLQGGGLTANGTLFTQGITPGAYFLMVRIRDSAGQEKNVYLADAVSGQLRRVTIDQAPIVAVATPAAPIFVQPGAVVDVTLQARDPEGNGQVRVFRDLDSVFNGNEVYFAEFPLTDTTQSLTAAFDTASIPPGTYRIGAAAEDVPGLAPSVSYAPGSVRINAPPTVAITAPTGPVQVQSGQPVPINWSVSDPEGRLDSVEVLLAPDVAPPDGQPDGDWQVLRTIVGSDTAVIRSHQIQTDQLVGRYVAAVRATDDALATAIALTPAPITVINLPPDVSMLEPFDLTGYRGTETIQVRFIVTDPEQRLAPQPNGVVFFIASISDVDTPLITITQGLRSGSNTVNFNTSQLLQRSSPGGPYLFLDEGGNGAFVIGVRATDQAGNVTTDYVPDLLEIDTVAPRIELLAPFDLSAPIPFDRIDTIDFRIRVTDTSPTAALLILDRTLDPDDNEFDIIALRPGETGVDRFFDLFDPLPPGFEPIERVYSFRVSDILRLRPNGTTLTGLPSGQYFVYLVVADAVQPAVEFYAPQAGDQEDPDQLVKIRIRDRLISPRVALGDFGGPQGPPTTGPLAGNVPDGGVFRGFNFNDLAGSVMSRVPDLNNNGRDEFVIVSRFAKPFGLQVDGVGWGEAYLIYGTAPSSRLRGTRTLNSVGQGGTAGVVFTGPRARLNSKWTAGLSDFTFIPDMDGDELPELAFGFPYCESVSLAQENPTVQDTRLRRDIAGMGELEYDAYYGIPPVWHTKEAQFTRGGVVIVSSQNLMLQSAQVNNRRGTRVLDLAEVGQMFTGMSRPSLQPYIMRVRAGISDAPSGVSVPGFPAFAPYVGSPGRGTDTYPAGEFCSDCVPNVFDDGDPPTCQAGCGPCGGIQQNPLETTTRAFSIVWDVRFNNQGPGGFQHRQTAGPTFPPLANPSIFPWDPNVGSQIFPLVSYPNRGLGSESPLEFPTCFDLVPELVGCIVKNYWHVYGAFLQPFPCGNPMTTIGIPSWNAPDGTSIWTGFYGPNSQIHPLAVQSSVGARVLGQAVDDQFGTHLAATREWLLIGAPERTALRTDVETLPVASRSKSGVVYQLRANLRTTPGGPSQTQLWLEPGTTWPTPDAQIEGRSDPTMPVPHQYIAETIGSLRGPGSDGTTQNEEYLSICPPSFLAGELGRPASACPFGPTRDDQSADLIQSINQIVGSRTDMKISAVRALGRVNDDQREDIAIGTENYRINPTDPNPVGAVFILYTRESTIEGDRLLENIALPPSDPNRLRGVLIVGDPNDGSLIGKAFDNAGDFNGDGFDDVIIGNPLAHGQRGEALIVFGATELTSPSAGFLTSQIVDGIEDDPSSFEVEYRPPAGIRFIGPPGVSLAGAMVAGVGDVDGDGIDDILIAAPNGVDPALADPSLLPAGATPVQGVPGVVYLVYGSRRFQDFQSPDFNRTIDLSLIGTPALPGARFVGRTSGDKLGAGTVTINNVIAAPTSVSPNVVVNARGLAALGDIDGDGRADYAISAMLADPLGQANAGEVYVIYGRGDLLTPGQ